MNERTQIKLIIFLAAFNLCAGLAQKNALMIGLGIGVVLGWWPEIRDWLKGEGE